MPPSLQQCETSTKDISAVRKLPSNIKRKDLGYLDLIRDQSGQASSWAIAQATWAWSCIFAHHVIESSHPYLILSFTGTHVSLRPVNGMTRPLTNNTACEYGSDPLLFHWKNSPKFPSVPPFKTSQLKISQSYSQFENQNHWLLK